MKSVIIISILLCPILANAQVTQKLFGNGYYDIGINKFGWLNGTDTLFILSSSVFDFRKPIKLTGTQLGTSSMNVLVKGTDSTIYQIPVSSIVPTMASGRWLPTISSENNLTSITVDSAQYIRQGDIVSYSIRVNATITAGATPSGFDFTLPIASDFGVDEDLIGIVSTSAGTSGYGYGDATNETGEITFTPTLTGVVTIIVTGHYKITPP